VLDHYPTDRDHEPALLSTHAVHADTTVVIVVEGELDLATAPRLQREVLALLALPVHVVTLDLDALTFMDSSGLNLLNRVRNEADDHGIKLTLRNVQGPVRKVLDLTHMVELFTIE
jgi:stage II sporulation protein AA (anti-sigma F factor antagonist)